MSNNPVVGFSMIAVTKELWAVLKASEDPTYETYSVVAIQSICRDPGDDREFDPCYVSNLYLLADLDSPELMWWMPGEEIEYLATNKEAAAAWIESQAKLE